MLRMVSGLLLAVACLDGQGIRNLLLPQSRHIVGMVVDPEGKPVVEAQIYHSNDHRQAPKRTRTADLSSTPKPLAS
jgi:hypothetical protein